MQTFFIVLFIFIVFAFVLFLAVNVGRESSDIVKPRKNDYLEFL